MGHVDLIGIPAAEFVAGRAGILGRVGRDPAVTDAISTDAEAMDGLIDEITIYDRALSLAEIQSIYTAGSGGKCAIRG